MDPGVIHWEPKDFQHFFEYLFPAPRSVEDSAQQESHWQPIIGDDVLADVGCAVAERVTHTRELEADITLTLVLGSGANGDVRLGEWKRDGGFCAVKSIAKSGPNAVSKDDIIAEVELLLSIEHPQIVHLDFIYEDEMQVHLVMEHLDGGELFDRIFDAGFTELQASVAFAQMLQAVAYLHRNEIMHGDLKPENFVYKHKGGEVLKLIDFGFAARLPRDGSPLTDGRGSLHYVAPEVLARAYDEKADLWSMGILLYVMLVGDSPWPGSDAQVLRRISAAEPRFEPQAWKMLSPAARQLIDSLLHARPTSRPSAEEALVHPWLNRKLTEPCATLPSQELFPDIRSKAVADAACDYIADALSVFHKFDDPTVTTAGAECPAVVKPLSLRDRIWSAWVGLCIMMWQSRGTQCPAKSKLRTAAHLPTASSFAKILLLRILMEWMVPGLRPVKNAFLMLRDNTPLANVI